MVFLIRFTLAFALLASLSACSSLSGFLFFPHEGHYQTPEGLGVDYKTIHLDSEGFQLENWLLLPKEHVAPKGTVLYLHGNGENISTHMNSVAWLTLEGYKVFLLDYRGYGNSEGASTLRSALYDVFQAHLWLSKHEETPLFLFGQSMGGALAITYSANINELEKSELAPIRALITESSPADWPQVAREAMRNHWLTWLVQIPASFIESKYNPEDHIGQLAGLPILLMHSKQDPIVRYAHLEQLLTAADKAGVHIETYQTLGGHTQGLAYEQARKRFIEFIQNVEPK
ncbi:hypothetical protein A3742_00945 [Oleiphilus sp. HI0071]|nr:MULTISPECIES: alpha/beta fold hydrolase [unclassified Oleiphilus]KZY61814.1 hypothetical protein A3737_21365 [Oleiphilus sp. HI0065]KZY83020.1 hypothetical protein A3742_00945 [Oleiphilus sp. HI0071]KZY98765.1 hypothetical protein A3744_12670 [Oleiphilus sp. HI0073]KZZ40725.1 hypothetical protein A3758_08390 [Oleiphilus sp. HI0118]KZZ51465.1 hypothetical protein A3760_19085 [Oleiphilus sp. HI0122]KZZ82240.1 hypothetical protein A3767_04245 [Oleiphilus sp. HI0133]